MTQETEHSNRMIDLLFANYDCNCLVIKTDMVDHYLIWLKSEELIAEKKNPNREIKR